MAQPPISYARAEGQSFYFSGTLMTLKAGSAETNGQFSLIEQVSPAGFATPLHVHHGEDEANRAGPADCAQCAPSRSGVADPAACGTYWRDRNAPPHTWLCWVAAVAVLAVVPFFGKVGGFAVEPTHFVERHGLVLLIALGESIISIGVGAADEPVTLALVLAAVLTLGLNAALWWSYFAQDDQRAEHALRSVSGGARARMALYAFGYAHLIMIAGIVVLATGIKQEVAQLQAATSFTTITLLASGITLYLLGDVLFRRTVRIPSSRLRLGMALVSLVTIPLGMWAGGLAQVGALLVLFVIMLSLEHAAAKPAFRPTAQETQRPDTVEVQ